MRRKATFFLITMSDKIFQIYRHCKQANNISIQSSLFHIANGIWSRFMEVSTSPIHDVSLIWKPTQFLLKKTIYEFFVSIYIQYKFKTSNKGIMNLPGPRRLLMIPLNAISSRYHRSTLWSDCQNKTQNWYLYNSLTSNIPIITNLNITYSSKFCNEAAVKKTSTHPWLSMRDFK